MVQGRVLLSPFVLSRRLRLGRPALSFFAAKPIPASIGQIPPKVRNGDMMQSRSVEFDFSLLVELFDFGILAIEDGFFAVSFCRIPASIGQIPPLKPPRRHF